MVSWMNTRSPKKNYVSFAEVKEEEEKDIISENSKSGILTIDTFSYIALFLKR